MTNHTALIYQTWVLELSQLERQPCRPKARQKWWGRLQAVTICIRKQ
jgi:hypothetical protein